MANRYYNQFCHSFRKKLTFLEGNFVVGTTGGVGTTFGAGISSVALVSTGKYRITFMDKYRKFLGASFTFDEGSAGASGVDEVNVIAPQTAVAAGYLDVQMRNAGTAAAPTTATTFYFNVMLDNTTVLPKNE